MTTGSRESEGSLPYSNETIPPASAREAFEDLARFVARDVPRERVVELMSGVDASRIVQAVQGMPVRPPLNGFELMVAGALDYHTRKGLIRTPVEALTALTSVKMDLQEGGVFVGRESRAVAPIPQPKP